jgi:hypothetical protein
MNAKTKIKLAMFYAKHRKWLVPAAVVLGLGAAYLGWQQFGG